MRKNIIKNKSKNYFALDVDRIYKLQLILTNNEEINSENKDFIENLKEISTQEERCFIVFDKKDVTLKINIDKIKMKKSTQKYYSIVDEGIYTEKKDSEDIIIKMLEHIPNHLTIRLEADKIEKIIEFMKSKILYEKLKEQETKFLLKGIEIKPRIIKSKMNEADLKNEVKETEAKRDRLNMDCDK